MTDLKPGAYGSFEDVESIRLRAVHAHGIQFWYAVTLPDEEPLPVDNQTYWINRGELWGRVFLAFGYPWTAGGEG